MATQLEELRNELETTDAVFGELMTRLDDLKGSIENDPQGRAEVELILVYLQAFEHKIAGVAGSLEDARTAAWGDWDEYREWGTVERTRMADYHHGCALELRGAERVRS